jgi:hypothetical protein
VPQMVEHGREGGLGLNRIFRRASTIFASIWVIVALVVVHEGCQETGSILGLEDASDVIESDGPGESSVDVTVHDAHADRDAHHPLDARAHDAHDATVDGSADVDGGRISDASVEDAAPDVDGGPPTLVALSVTSPPGEGGSSTLALVPPFSPAITDYFVRCSGATNAAVVSMTASPGAESSLTAPVTSPSRPTQTVSISVNANQAIVAVASKGTASLQYWVRCLPSSFPTLTLEPHPEAGAPAPGYYLVGTYDPCGGGYSMVLDGNGVPVWYYATSGGVTNVDTMVDGSVSWLQLGGGPTMRVEIDPLKAILASPNDAPIDFHELRILPNGDYVIISSPARTGVDLTGLDGSAGCAVSSDATIIDCNVLEFDPKSGKVVWSWSAIDHFDPVEVSMHPIPGGGRLDGGGFATGCDVFHCNAVDVNPVTGNLLISARQTFSFWYVERATGRVMWKMGGSPDSLDHATFVPVTDTFDGQHDPRLQPGWSECTGGQVSLFDDETWGTLPARGLVFDVHVSSLDGGCEAGPPTSSLAWQYQGTTSVFAEGSHRVQSDGTHVIGWGLQGDTVLSEVSQDGGDMLDIVGTGSCGPMFSYRAIKVPTTAMDLASMRATAGGP